VSVVADGAALAQAAARAGDKACAICGNELGAERWWVIPGEYPRGEHERCRDWSAYPFPFERQLDELRKIYRRVAGQAGLAAGRLVTEAAGRELRGLEARWPHEALAILDEGRRVVGRAKNELAAAGVDPKVIARL